VIVIHVFIKQIFRAAEKSSLLPLLPPQCFAGGGVLLVLFNPKLRIRVKKDSEPYCL
jgi:hypothetical protein